MKFDQPIDLGSIIKVIGVGGGGSNAVNHMFAQGIKGVDFLVCNTDRQALDISPVPTRLQLGAALTEGLGAGSVPDRGKHAAHENIDQIRQVLSQRTKMVFITAGMGGGTGTGGAPVVAKVAKESGALTVGVVTKPFLFEGKKRMRQAEDGMRELKASVDTLIAIPNQRLLAVAGRNTSIVETFKKADDVLLQAVRGISDLITVHGLINLDFADVRTIMAEMGMAMMGAAIASGENRAVEAAQKAISSPLLEDVSIEGARGVLINITGAADMSLGDVNSIADLVKEAVGEESEIIFGAVNEPAMQGEVRVTVIATGFAKRAGQGHIATPSRVSAVGALGSTPVIPLNPAARASRPTSVVFPRVAPHKRLRGGAGPGRRATQEARRAACARSRLPERLPPA